MNTKSAAVLSVITMLGAWSGSSAAPLPPPGGHLPFTFGGANQAGYPVVDVTDVDEPVPPLGLLSIPVTTMPNPFRGETVFQFALEAGAQAQIEVYDLQGRRVWSVAHAAGEPGTQHVVWDGNDAAGRRLGSGIYLYRLESNGRLTLGRMVLLR